EQSRLRGLRPEDAERGQHPFRLEVMVRPLRAGAALAAAGKGTDGHRGFAIQGQPQRLGIRSRLLMHLLHVGKDGVGLLYFFWGRHLATLRSRKPKAFNFTPMVCTLGSSSAV